MLEHAAYVDEFYVFAVRDVTKKWETITQTFTAPDFVQRRCKIADRYRISYRFLVVELTETDIWENEEILFDMAD